VQNVEKNSNSGQKYGVEKDNTETVITALTAKKSYGYKVPLISSHNPNILGIYH